MMVLKLWQLFLTIAFVLGSMARGQFLYLNNGAFKFISGIGLPVDVEIPSGSIDIFTDVQVFYHLPDNITYYEPYKIVHKRSVKSTFNRPTIYQALTKYFERLGFSGSECLHRLICEVSRRKINRKSNGLVGEIIHILFSPLEDVEGSLEEHKNAQRQGMHNATDCSLMYQDCYIKENSIFLS